MLVQRQISEENGKFLPGHTFGDPLGLPKRGGDTRSERTSVN
jgi:hypothetical protein